MKIRTLTFCNLHALRGEFKLDFLSPPLSDTGLFAITGDTGSGKSTLLDAITLALYGRIHRYERGSKIDEVMTQGTGFCWAEVEFESRGGIYLARYERRRAHGKPQGKLQQPVRKLFRLSPSGKTLPLTDKIREMDEKLETLTGLDFKRFTRSVLLAQGDFAAFLKAKKDERSALLEQITGTEIYSEISKSCYERYTEEAKQLESLRKEIDRLQLPSREERQGIHRELVQLDREISKWHREREVLEGQKSSFAELRQLQRERQQWEAQKRELEIQQSAFAPDQKRLNFHKAALPLQKDLNNRQRLLAAREEEEQKAQSLRLEMQRGETSLKTNSETLQRAEKRLQELQQAAEKREKLFAEVEKLDTRCKVVEERLPELQKRLDIALNEKKHAAEEWQQTRKKLEELNRRLVDVKAFLSENKKLEQFLDKQELIADKLKLYNKIQARYQRVLKEQADLRQVWENLETDWKAWQTEAGRREEALKKRERILASELGAGFIHDPWLWLKDLDDRLLAGERGENREDLSPLYQKRERAAKEWESWKKEREALQELRLQRNPLQEKHAQAFWALQQAEERAKALQKELEDLADSWRTELSELALPEQNPKALLEKLSAFRQKREERDRLLQEGTSLDVAEKHLAKALEEKTKIAAELQAEKHLLERGIQDLQDERKALLGLQSVETARRIQAEELAGMRDRVGRLKEEIAALMARQQNLQKQLEQAVAKQHQVDQQRQLLENHLQETAIKRGFANLEALQTALLPEEVEADLSRRAAALEERSIRLSEQGKRLGRALETARAKTQSLDEEKLDAALQACRERQEAALERKGRLQQQAEQWDTLSKKHRALQEQLEEQKELLAGWEALNALIGSSDGKKFRTFAQSLTLRNLVALANVHLQRLNARYFLQVRAESRDLELDIVDTHLANHRRSVFTLSGGESFLASLALALGLSDMVGHRARIHSLFIDEGFGSLDANTLDQALSALEQLQGSGKTIGLISHVRAMQERIPVQIVLKKLGGGLSSLEVRS